MDKKFLNALIISVVLHLALIVVLFVGDFTTETKPQKSTAVAQEVKPIQATVIDSAKLQKAINKIKKQKADDKAAEKKRIKDIEKRASEANDLKLKLRPKKQTTYVKSKLPNANVRKKLQQNKLFVSDNSLIKWQRKWPREIKLASSK